MAYKINIPHKKIVGLCASVIVILAGAALYYYSPWKESDQNITPSKTPAYSSDGVNYSPPTEQEKQNADKNKDAILNNEPKTGDTTNTNEKKSVKPVISYASQQSQVVEVGGNVPDIYEEGGECTVKLTKGSDTLSKSIQAIPNVTYNTCPALEIPVSELPSKGQWNVVLSYSSPKATGVSDSVQVEVN